MTLHIRLESRAYLLGMQPLGETLRLVAGDDKMPLKYGVIWTYLFFQENKSVQIF